MSAISIPIISDFNGKGIDKAIREFKKLETSGQKASFAIKKAALPAAAAIGGLAVIAFDAVKAFMEDDKAAQLLATSLRNTTGATDAQIASVEKFITKTSIAAAVSDDELRPALDKLVRGTGDVTKAQNLLSLALDISAGTGKDLGAVSDALSKAFNGTLGPLKKLDPALASLIENGATTDEVFAALGKTFAGAASTSANTASGKMKSFSIQMGEFKESVGAAVFPIVNKLLPAFQSIAGFIQKNTTLVVAFGVVFASLAVSILAVNAAMKAYAAIQAIVNVATIALTASTYALWVATGVAVIVAIVAALVALQVKFDIFGKAINGIKIGFDKLWGAIKFVFDWAKNNWPLLLAILIGPFGLAIAFVVKFRDNILSFFTQIYNGIKANVGKWLNIIKTPFVFGEYYVAVFRNNVMKMFSLIYAGIKATMGFIANVITAPFKAAFRVVAWLWNNTVGKLSFKIPSWVPMGIGGKGWDVPDIPMLAEGGIVTSPTLAMIGEGRGPEAVIPLSKLGSMGFGGGGGMNITVNVNGGDPNSIVRALQQYVRNTGPLPVSIQ